MFSENPQSKYWSKKNNISASQVTSSSGKKYLFDCPECKHEYSMCPKNITHNNQGCPFCSNKLLCNNDDCKLCFDNSFASHPFANCWSTKNDKTSRQTFKGSSHDAWFKCNECNHEFQFRISRANCPYCNNKQLCDNDNCLKCYRKSFANSKNAKYWSNSKNENKPRQVFKNTHNKAWFKCLKCNYYYYAKIRNVANGKFHWCVVNNN